MRDRAWRRHIEERVIIKRLKRDIISSNNWWSYSDVNRNYYKKVLIVDFLEKPEFSQYKTHTTKRYDSKHKVKYSPNKNKPYYRDGRKKFLTREKDKIFFLNILKENGLK